MSDQRQPKNERHQNLSSMGSKQILPTKRGLTKMTLVHVNSILTLKDAFETFLSEKQVQHTLLFDLSINEFLLFRGLYNIKNYRNKNDQVDKKMFAFLKAGSLGTFRYN